LSTVPSVVDEDEELEEEVVRLRAEVERLQERVEDVEELVDGYDVGELYTKAMTRVLELENENERLKKVLDAVCEETGVNPDEVLADDGGDES